MRDVKILLTETKVGVSTMRKTTIVCLAVLLPLILLASGCGNKFFDPTQIGRFRPIPTVNTILDTLGVAEESPSPYETAEDPRPADVVSQETDYVLGPGDVVRITIFELRQEGIPFVNDFTVTETGKIPSIPEIGMIHVSGLTEAQLEDEIRRSLSPGYLKDPSVIVSLLFSQRRVFSIYGDGVRLPSRYAIPRYDFRLTDALSQAGGIGQFNISYIYVTRKVTGDEALEAGGEIQIDTDELETVEPRQLTPEEEMLEIIKPSALNHNDKKMLTLSEMAAESMLQDDLELTDLTGQNDEIIQAQAGGADVQWVYRDGKWEPIAIGDEQEIDEASPDEGLGEQLPEEFGWGEIGTGGVQTRVIKIPAEFLGSDPRYNIIIKPGDTIKVPVDIVGEFYVLGNANNQGIINLTGREMTLMMAVSAAGGLGPLAWPDRVEVRRRIARNKEEIVLVNLTKISDGTQPDFFIKPNDVINIGSHPTARWRAILRNAFRATYGFGFIYDRNFADRDVFTRRPIPRWF